MVIYEFVILVPVIKQPDQVKAELNNQIQEIKAAWAGLRMVKDIIKPQVEELENQQISLTGNHQMHRLPTPVPKKQVWAKSNPLTIREAPNEGSILPMRLEAYFT